MGSYTTSNDPAVDKFWGDMVRLQGQINSSYRRLIDVVQTKAEHDRRTFLLNDIRSKRISAIGRKIIVR